MSYIGIEQTVFVDGKPYRLSRLTRGLVNQWLEWADQQLDNPIEPVLAALPQFAPEVQVRIIRELRFVRRSLSDPDVETLWLSRDGIQKRFGLCLYKYQPLLTEAEQHSIFDAMEEQDGIVAICRVLARASGYIPQDPSAVERQYLTELGKWQPASSDKPIDWAQIDAKLFQEFHLTPVQVDEMTLPEIMVICQGKPTLSLFELEWQASLWRTLTPEQKIELAYRQLQASRL